MCVCVHARTHWWDKVNLIVNVCFFWKLPPPNKLNRYPDDLLFYLYYNNGGDLFQLAVTAEL